MKNFRSLRYALAAATVLGFGGNAFALDGNDLVAKINAGLQSAKLTPASVDVSGSTVTLKGVKVQPSEGASEGGAIGDVVLSNVAEDGNGGYTIEKAAFNNVDMTNDGVTLTASDIALSNISIPGDVSKPSLDSMIFYETGHVGPVKIVKGGTEVMSLAATDFSMSKMDDNAGLEFEFGATGLKADLSKVDDPKAKETLEKIKLTSLDGEIHMAGSWETASGTIDLDSINFDFKDVGMLSLAFNLSGYTLDLVKSLQEQMKSMETNPNKEAAQQAAGLAIMGLAQQLTFNSASISFDDSSITSRVLDYVGSEQGMSGRQFAQSLKGMVPIMVAQLNVPDLQNAITEAVNTYLDDPKNLTISAEPEKGVPFPQIIGAAMGAPQTLPKVLGVTVSANEAD